MAKKTFPAGTSSVPRGEIQRTVLNDAATQRAQYVELVNKIRSINKMHDELMNRTPGLTPKVKRAVYKDGERKFVPLGYHVVGEIGKNIEQRLVVAHTGDKIELQLVSFSRTFQCYTPNDTKIVTSLNDVDIFLQKGKLRALHFISLAQKSGAIIPHMNDHENYLSHLSKENVALV